MANYYGKGRSNYVRIKEDKLDDFKALVELGDGEVIVDREGRYGFLTNDADGYGELSFFYFEDDVDQDTKDLLSRYGIKLEEDENVGTDFFIQLIAPMMEDGEVLIYTHTGAEKMRYLGGWAMAINNKGEEKSIGLHNIYDLAKELGENVTLAEY